jgi:hypothetical protein
VSPGRKPGPDAAQLRRVRRALATKEPLVNVREAIAERNREQKVVVWAFACILETGAAGLPILLDRFTRAELGRIEAALEEIGARVAVKELRALRRAFEKARGAGKSRYVASDAVGGSRLGRAVTRRHATHVEEMEARLLAYCRQHVERLAAV